MSQTHENKNSPIVSNSIPEHTKSFNDDSVWIENFTKILRKKNIPECITHYFKLVSEDRPTDLMNATIRHWFSELFVELVPAWEEYWKNLPKKYIYMLTFTLAPQHLDKYKLAESYIVNQAKRKETLGIKEMHYVYETTKAGNPHWHVAIETSIPLKKNRFSQYIKNYGHIDLSRTKGQIIKTVLKYINKTNSSTQLV